MSELFHVLIVNSIEKAIIMATAKEILLFFCIYTVYEMLKLAVLQLDKVGYR